MITPTYIHHSVCEFFFCFLPFIDFAIVAFHPKGMHVLNSLETKKERKKNLRH